MSDYELRRRENMVEFRLRRIAHMMRLLDLYDLADQVDHGELALALKYLREYQDKIDGLIADLEGFQSDH